MDEYPKWYFAQGKFSEVWVAIYETEYRTFYGYGRSKQEAMKDALKPFHSKSDTTD